MNGVHPENILATGTIKTKLKDDDRLKEIERQLSDAIQEFNPEILAIETQYLTGYKTNAAVLKTSFAAGYMAGVFHRLVPHGKIIFVTPLEGKQALGSSGVRNREEQKKLAVQCVKQQFKMDVSNDIADAFGIGLAGWAKYMTQ